MLPLPLPLLRVLDLTTSIAGASASRSLADYGAEVIAIERSLVSRETFLQHGRNKFSCALEPSAPEARELLLGLAAGCDVVLRDAGDEALQASALDYEAFRRAREDVVLVTISEGGVRPGLGNVAAAAAMVALFNVRFRGQGQEVRVGLAAAGASMRSAAIVAASAGAAAATPDLPPSGCYRCSDGVIALVVRTPEQLAALGDVAGRPEIVDLVSGGDELRSAVEGWTSQRAAHAAAAELREAGVAAQPVLTPADLRDDPHLRARGLFEPVAKDGGVVEMDGPRVRFSATPLHVRLPAPAFGQHTAYVLRVLAGLSDAEIEVLAMKGVVAVRPLGAQ